jgi:hypothetical protein
VVVPIVARGKVIARTGMPSYVIDLAVVNERAWDLSRERLRQGKPRALDLMMPARNQSRIPKEAFEWSDGEVK